MSISMTALQSRLAWASIAGVLVAIAGLLTFHDSPRVFGQARIHRFIQVDGVRTAEGCEGVTGAIIRA